MPDNKAAEFIARIFLLASGNLQFLMSLACTKKGRERNVPAKPRADRNLYPTKDPQTTSV
jgi:hypothetical protein